MTKITFNEARERNFEKLEQFTPIIDRVHGGNHPEFHEVKDLWETIYTKTEHVDADKPELNAEFSRLREVTNDYEVPGDVCESYEAVYNMLEEVDAAYQV